MTAVTATINTILEKRWSVPSPSCPPHKHYKNTTVKESFVKKFSAKKNRKADNKQQLCFQTNINITVTFYYGKRPNFLKSTMYISEIKIK